jgi:hypothetical protein
VILPVLRPGVVTLCKSRGLLGRIVDLMASETVSMCQCSPSLSGRAAGVSDLQVTAKSLNRHRLHLSRDSSAFGSFRILLHQRKEKKGFREKGGFDKGKPYYGSCGCRNALRDQHLETGGNRPLDCTEGRKVRVSAERGSAVKLKKSNAGLRVSCREVAEASDVVPSNSRSFLKPAAFQDEEGSFSCRSGPERWPDIVEGYACGQAFHENLPECLAEPPLWKLGNADNASTSGTVESLRQQEGPSATLNSPKQLNSQCCKPEDRQENASNRRRQVAKGDFQTVVESAAPASCTPAGSIALVTEQTASLNGAKQSQARHTETDMRLPLQSLEPFTDIRQVDVGHANGLEGGPNGMREPVAGNEEGEVGSSNTAFPQRSESGLEGSRVTVQALIEGREFGKLVEFLDCSSEQGVSPESICSGREIIDMLAQYGSVDLALR